MSIKRGRMDGVTSFADKAAVTLIVVSGKEAGNYNGEGTRANECRVGVLKPC